MRSCLINNSVTLFSQSLELISSNACNRPLEITPRLPSERCIRRQFPDGKIECRVVEKLAIVVVAVVLNPL